MALTAIVVMLLISIKRNHNLIATTSVVGLNLAAIFIAYTAYTGHYAPVNVMGMFMVDPFTMLFIASPHAQVELLSAEQFQQLLVLAYNYLLTIACLNAIHPRMFVGKYLTKPNRSHRSSR